MSESPPQFHYERQTIALTLHAGESAVADFQLLPRKREIRLMQNGEAPLVAAPQKQRK